jgi:hypothetical protein
MPYLTTEEKQSYSCIQGAKEQDLKSEIRTFVL